MTLHKRSHATAMSCHNVSFHTLLLPAWPLASISVMRPQEMPATGAMIGTPASMRAKQPPQIEAIELPPKMAPMKLA